MFSRLPHSILCLAVIAFSAAPAPVIAGRTLDEGTFPHRKTVDVWPYQDHLPAIREVASGDWLALYVQSWLVKDSTKLEEFLTALTVRASLDGVPLPVEYRQRTMFFDYCNPSDPECLTNCPDGMVPLCDNTDGCEILLTSFVALAPPQSIGTHVAAGEWALSSGVSPDTVVSDGWCSVPAWWLEYGESRFVLVTPRSLYPTLPVTPR